MVEVIVPVVAILGVFVFAPLIVTGGILGGRFIRMKQRELDLRERELETELRRQQLEERSFERRLNEPGSGM